MSQNKIGIDLIIHDLETTDDGFLRGILHGTLVGQDEDGKSIKKCGYCGEGILLKEAGVDKDSFIGFGSIGALRNDGITARIKLIDRYGINFNKEYPFIPSTGVFGVRCMKCDLLIRGFRDFEDVITHINDTHSYNHKELAGHLKELNSYYDLTTGEKR